jgi:hypothetical protein
MVELVPYLNILKGRNIPRTLEHTYAFLKNFERSKVCIDTEFEMQGKRPIRGRSEGVVLRNNERSKIYKIRFEDYEKTERKVGHL